VIHVCFIKRHLCVIGSPHIQLIISTIISVIDIFMCWRWSRDILKHVMLTLVFPVMYDIFVFLCIHLCFLSTFMCFYVTFMHLCFEIIFIMCFQVPLTIQLKKTNEHRESIIETVAPCLVPDLDRVWLFVSFMRFKWRLCVTFMSFLWHLCVFCSYICHILCLFYVDIYVFLWHLCVFVYRIFVSGLINSSKRPSILVSVTRYRLKLSSRVVHFQIKCHFREKKSWIPEVSTRFEGFEKHFITIFS